MATLDRVKCTASVNGAGLIVIGTAEPGYITPTNSWAAGFESHSFTPYVLQDGSGNFEFGTIYVDVGLAVHRDAYGGNYMFPNGSTGLTFMQAPLVSDVLALNKPKSWAPAVSGGGAYEPDILVSNGVSIGVNSSLTGSQVTALGASASAVADYTTAIGCGAVAGFTNSVVVGSNASVNASASTAIGHGVIAMTSGETAVGASLAVACHRQIPIRLLPMTSASGVKSFADAGGLALDLGAYQLDGNVVNGPVRVYGTVCVEDSAQYGVQAYSKVFTIDYVLWLVAGTSTGVIGTSTVTATYSGASAVTATLAIHATTGVPTLSVATASRTVRGRGLLKLSFINTLGGE